MAPSFYGTDGTRNFFRLYSPPPILRSLCSAHHHYICANSPDELLPVLSILSSCIMAPMLRAQEAKKRKLNPPARHTLAHSPLPARSTPSIPTLLQRSIIHAAGALLLSRLSTSPGEHPIVSGEVSGDDVESMSLKPYGVCLCTSVISTVVDIRCVIAR